MHFNEHGTKLPDNMPWTIIYDGRDQVLTNVDSHGNVVRCFEGDEELIRDVVENNEYAEHIRRLTQAGVSATAMGTTTTTADIFGRVAQNDI